jgi:hypothetical protein
MKTFRALYNEIITESRKIPRIERHEVKALLDAGHKITAASLYEPDHAPKTAKFAMANYGEPGKPKQIRLIRIHPPASKSK